jgi:hypothetical protein
VWNSDNLMISYRGLMRFAVIAGHKRTGNDDSPKIIEETRQTPYRCQSRNHGLWASISSCRRLAANRSLGLSVLLSGTAKMRSSHSISEMSVQCPFISIIQHELGMGQTDAASVFSNCVRNSCY